MQRFTRCAAMLLKTKFKHRLNLKQSIYEDKK